MANTKKRCKWCRDYFPAEGMTKTPAGTFCTFDHTLAFLREKQRKDSDKAHRERKKAFYDKERPRQLKLAQKAVNASVRERDIQAGYGCISCGTKDPGIQYAAGHFRTIGASPHLRFNTRNIHLQCNRRCNMALSGNLLEFRKGLKERYGEEFVDSLESSSDVLKLTVEQIIDIKIYYLNLLKAMKAN